MSIQQILLVSYIFMVLTVVFFIASIILFFAMRIRHIWHILKGTSTPVYTLRIGNTEAITTQITTKELLEKEKIQNEDITTLLEKASETTLLEQEADKFNIIQEDTYIQTKIYV